VKKRFFALENGPILENHRTIEGQGKPNRKDEILRAAVSAFVALSKPNIRDCNQIEDLAAPIFGIATPQTKRFVAAALAESRAAPVRLVKLICAEPIEICATLLLRTPVLSAVDIVNIIGKQGKSYARVIAQRHHLPNDVIEALALVEDPLVRERVSRKDSAEVGLEGTSSLKNVKPVSVDDAINLLREIMVDSAGPMPANVEIVEPSLDMVTARLVRLALSEEEGLFATAMADVCSVSYARALKLLRRSSSSELATALRANSILTGDAYLICSVFYPSVATNRTEIRLFKDRFEAMAVEQASEMLRQWKADEISIELRRKGYNQDTTAEDTAISA
jgi:uncharacterized protein (DUF2336 family)